MTLPRMLGYVFNPVSFWFCRDRAGALRAVLCEVNNTFGESIAILSTTPIAARSGPDEWLEGRKVFHVSPSCRSKAAIVSAFASKRDWRTST